MTDYGAWRYFFKGVQNLMRPDFDPWPAGFRGRAAITGLGGFATIEGRVLNGQQVEYWGPFIEMGVERFCVQGRTPYRPYTSYTPAGITVASTGIERRPVTKTSLNISLNPNGFYRYKVCYVGDDNENLWLPLWCPDPNEDHCVPLSDL
jgi:hypothetical protein